MLALVAEMDDPAAVRFVVLEAGPELGHVWRARWVGARVPTLPQRLIPTANHQHLNRATRHGEHNGPDPGRFARGEPGDARADSG